MEKEELIKFLKWLDEEGIARWYCVEKESDGEDELIDRYLNKNIDNPHSSKPDVNHTY